MTSSIKHVLWIESSNLLELISLIKLQLMFYDFLSYEKMFF